MERPGSRVIHALNAEILTRCRPLIGRDLEFQKWQSVWRPPATGFPGFPGQPWARIEKLPAKPPPSALFLGRRLAGMDMTEQGRRKFRGAKKRRFKKRKTPLANASGARIEAVEEAQ